MVEQQPAAEPGWATAVYDYLVRVDVLAAISQVAATQSLTDIRLEPLTTDLAKALRSHAIVGERVEVSTEAANLDTSVDNTRGGAPRDTSAAGEQEGEGRTGSIRSPLAIRHQTFGAALVLTVRASSLVGARQRAGELIDWCHPVLDRLMATRIDFPLDSIEPGLEAQAHTRLALLQVLRLPPGAKRFPVYRRSRADTRTVALQDSLAAQPVTDAAVTYVGAPAGFVMSALFADPDRAIEVFRGAARAALPAGTVFDDPVILPRSSWIPAAPGTSVAGARSAARTTVPGARKSTAASGHRRDLTAPGQ